MKVGYLVNTYPRPSQTFIRREIHALERMGWQIHRFALRAPAEALADPADRDEAARTEYVLKAGAGRLLASAASLALRHPARAARSLALALRCGARGGGGVPGSGGRLRHLVYWLEAAHVARRCRVLGIPHLHAHFGTNSATVAMLAARAGGLSWSFTLHGPEEFDAPRAHSLGQKAASAAFTVTISSHGRSQLWRWTPLDAWGRVHVVHCGIEPDLFSVPAPLPDGPLRLIAIGRFAGQKGLPVLIEAMAQVRDRAPDVTLTLAGDGELRPHIEAQIARAGLGAQIRLAGWLDEAGVRAQLAGSHALVLPSFAEGLPMVVMEAFAAGRPAVATTVAGIPELVTRETGILVPAGDAEALATAILDFAAKPRKELAAMGAAGRRAVLARHDAGAEAAKLATLFTAALKG